LHIQTSCILLTHKTFDSLSTPYLGQGEQINFQGRSDD
jgi:hypothetical protein